MLAALRSALRRRALAPAGVFALALACSRPAAPEPAPLTLLPADASLIAHVDFQALRAAPLWQQNRELLDADPDARRTLDALAACRVPFENLRTLDLAVAPNGHDVAAVLVGDGVGERERITCLEGQLPERGLRLDTDGPEPTLVLRSARGRLHSPNLLVIATSGWLAQVDALRTAQPAPASAATGPLQPQLARIPDARPIWFVGQMPTRAAVALAPALSGLTQVRGALDLRDGLGLELALGMTDDTVAAATLAELRRQFDGLQTAGIPAPLLEHVVLGQSGSEVTIEVRLSMAEISLLRTLAGALRPPASASP